MGGDQSGAAVCVCVCCECMRVYPVYDKNIQSAVCLPTCLLTSSQSRQIQATKCFFACFPTSCSKQLRTAQISSTTSWLCVSSSTITPVIQPPAIYFTHPSHLLFAFSSLNRTPRTHRPLHQRTPHPTSQWHRHRFLSTKLRVCPLRPLHTHQSLPLLLLVHLSICCRHLAPQ